LIIPDIITDLYLNTREFFTLASAIVVTVGGIIALYLYMSRLKFAGGTWTIRSIGFYPPEAVKNIMKAEVVTWSKAQPGKTLPPETLMIESDDGSWIPVGGLTSFTATVTTPPPAVRLHFVIVNPSSLPAALKDVVLTVTRRNGDLEHKFKPSHFGKKDAPAEPGIPAGFHFEDYWGSILVQPASSSEHWLIFGPSQMDLSNPFSLVAGEYECSIEFRFERQIKLLRKSNKQRRINFRVDIDENMAKSWKHDEQVILPYNYIKDI
jgi:hypothetical protein